MTGPEEVGPGIAPGREKAELHPVAEIGEHGVERVAEESNGNDRQHSDECEYECVFSQPLPSLRAHEGTKSAELHNQFHLRFES